jgi:hypothetical protein
MNRSAAYLLRMLALAVCALTFGALFGQPPGNQGKDPKLGPGVSTVSLPSWSQALTDAKTAAKGNDAVTAESKLTATNVSSPGSASWHMETTQKLVQLAGDLAREGSAASVAPLAASALQHLRQAAATAPDLPTQADANAMMAVIYLNFNGDPVSAIASYKAAAKLAPKDPAIAAALNRLVDADARLRAKIHPPKK